MKLIWPLPPEYRTITTQFGEDGHMAADIAAPNYCEVYACMAGTLTGEYTPLGGNVARITSGSVVSRYCHLARPIPQINTAVQAGELVGNIGKSGTAWTGYHLHWETRVYGVAVNPLEYVGEGSMSKVALHFQQMTSWAASVVAQYWQFPRWVKVMNPPVPDAFPGSFVLGRAYLRANNDTWEKEMVAKGTQGGAEYFNALLPYYAERRGIVSAWEAANEPDISDTTKAAKYRDFLDEWSRLMHSVGLRCCGGSISVGNPKLKAFDGSNEELKIIAPALARCDYWSYHGYWQRPYDPADNWWAHRYRLIVSECAAMGITLPPLIISEVGADIGGGHNDGWRVQYANDWNAYFADIKRYSAELNKDAYVQAATFFTSGPNDDWDMFEIDQAQAIALGQFVVGDVVTPPVDDLLTWAETIVIPYNVNAALFKYIIGKGWIPQSPESMHDGEAYMWGWNRTANTRTLCGWISGAVVEVYSRPN